MSASAFRRGSRVAGRPQDGVGGYGQGIGRTLGSGRRGGALLQFLVPKSTDCESDTSHVNDTTILKDGTRKFNEHSEKDGYGEKDGSN